MRLGAHNCEVVQAERLPVHLLRPPGQPALAPSGLPSAGGSEASKEPLGHPRSRRALSPVPGWVWG